MANQPQQSQPSSGQAQQHSRQQAEQALGQHAQAHGFHLPPGVIAAILQLIEALASGGGVMPQAQAGQQPSP
jgi:hypothetical protein